MANTYSQVSIHIVFAVKGRENIVRPEIRAELFPYITGILKEKGHFPLAVNGWTDHVHVLFGLHLPIAIPDAARDIKANSSKWINERGFCGKEFRWQSGYGAFSCSKSHRDNTIKYIMNQEKHHAKHSFRKEYLEMLKSREIEFEEKYLFDFYDDP